VTIAVTGATGNLGRLVVEHLIARGTAADDIVAIGRNEQKLAALDGLGVRTAVADYGDRASLATAFSGVDTVMLVSGSEVGRRVPQHSNVIRAAEQADVAHIVYTSAPHADDSSLFVVPEHKATEDLLAASPVTATILRNNWYNENYVPNLAQIAQTGTYLASTGAGRVASAARSDFAEAAAVVAATDAHRGEILELAGDTAWDGAEFAQVAGRVLGRPVEFVSVDSAEHRAALIGAGLDEQTADLLTGMDASIAEGALDGPSHVLSSVIGHPTTPLEDTLRAAYAA
jgi:NAD(P)H dehydrogenase (quinone)